MAKFEIELELQGFKLKVKGEREDMPLIQHHLREQLGGLFQPATSIAAGELPAPIVTPAQPPPPAKTRLTRRRSVSKSDGEAAPIPSWAHDPGKWGVPRQAWSSPQKIAWLLYVVDQETKLKELSGPMLADTFNMHFRQAGLLRKGNMPRDLGSLKQRMPSWVGEHADRSPITWFLTEAGIAEAQKLVGEAKNGQQATF